MAELGSEATIMAKDYWTVRRLKRGRFEFFSRPEVYADGNWRAIFVLQANDGIAIFDALGEAQAVCQRLRQDCPRDGPFSVGRAVKVGS